MEDPGERRDRTGDEEDCRCLDTVSCDDPSGASLTGGSCNEPAPHNLLFKSLTTPALPLPHKPLHFCIQ